MNLTAKLQACAEAGQVAFPQELVEQPGVQVLLDEKQAKLVPVTFDAPGGGAMSVLRWDVNP